MATRRRRPGPAQGSHHGGKADRAGQQQDGVFDMVTECTVAESPSYVTVHCTFQPYGDDCPELDQFRFELIQRVRRLDRLATASTASR
jgi:hypothetical protein